MKLKEATDKRKYFFAQPVIRMWSSIKDIIKAKNLARFKEDLDVYMNSKNIQSCYATKKHIGGRFKLMFHGLNQSLSIRERMGAHLPTVGFFCTFF